MSAPDTLLGKKGKCPKCGLVMVIKPSEPVADPSRSSQIVVDDLPALVKTEGVPHRISYENLYLILNNDVVVSYWKRGEGWQIRASQGYVLARSADDLIPEAGEFVLVEGNVHQTEEGHRLVGIQFFKISGFSALKSLVRSDSEVFNKIVGRVPLGLNQKRQTLLFIRQHYFGGFTEQAGDIIEYLTNDDFQTTMIGDVKNADSAWLSSE